GERTVLVLLVPPASHDERRYGRMPPVARTPARPPHGVVRRMLPEPVPTRPPVRACGPGERCQGRKRAVPLVQVVAGRGGILALIRRRFHAPGVFGAVAQPEGPLVKEVV